MYKGCFWEVEVLTILQISSVYVRVAFTLHFTAKRGGIFFIKALDMERFIGYNIWSQDYLKFQLYFHFLLTSDLHTHMNKNECLIQYNFYFYPADSTPFRNNIET